MPPVDTVAARARLRHEASLALDLAFADAALGTGIPVARNAGLRSDRSLHHPM